MVSNMSGRAVGRLLADRYECVVGLAHILRALKVIDYDLCNAVEFRAYHSMNL